MIARNFGDHPPGFLYPTIDMAGEKSGIIGAEFPLFNSLIHIFNKVFGYQHWYGRLINLIVSSFGVWYFYKLIAHIFTKKTAFYAAFLLLISIWLSFSRKIMPDTFSVSLVLIGLYFGATYLTDGRFYRLLIFGIGVCFGMMVKIPAAALLAGLAVLPMVEELPKKRVFALWAFALLGFIPVAIWYFHWVPELVDKYGFPLFFPKSLSQGFQEIKPLFPELLKKFYFSSFNSYIAFALVMGSLFFSLKEKSLALKLAMGVISTVFVVFIVKTGSVFPTHNYYIIPFVPVMALMAAFLLSKISNKYAVALLILISAESIANQVHDFKIKEKMRYKAGIEQIMDVYISKDAKILINGGQSPQLLYFTNRKGWTMEGGEISPKVIDSLETLGAEFMVIDRSYPLHKADSSALIFENEYIQIFKLQL